MSKRVLVIDDDEAARKSFLLALEEMNCEVEAVESGEIGIARAQNSPYDLVYLDLKMPGMNGVETLRAIRSFDADTPIYIVTAFHKEFLGQLQSALDDGLDFELLHKPVGGPKLREATSIALSRGVH